MNKRNLFVRITAIVLCALMVLSIVTVALYAFAAEPVAAVASPETGSESMVWVVLVAGAAVAVIIGCFVVPNLKKK